MLGVAGAVRLQRGQGLVPGHGLLRQGIEATMADLKAEGHYKG